jgi:4-hydroxy-tetrahydrodipicolinate reductase
MIRKAESLRLGLFGSSGKMGLSVEQLLVQNKKSCFSPYLAIGKVTSNIFSISANSINEVENEILDDVDVWIDFSSAEGLMSLLSATEKNKTPIVSGSTGLNENHFTALKKNSKTRALFWASNLSPGLWAFRQAIKSLGSISDFDFVIDEIHHNQKKDNPSGTAKTLQIDVEKTIGRKIKTPLSHRIGGVFGVHNVIAASKNEVITLQHQALNRNVFAEGALKAAEWVVEQKSGFYSMDDLYFKNKKENI